MILSIVLILTQSAVFGWCLFDAINGEHILFNVVWATVNILGVVVNSMLILIKAMESNNHE
jgi:hypothetical protein